MSLNKVMLIGNVGKDPEVRHLDSGVSTASFTLATTERFKDRSGEMKEQTEWHNIVCWRSLADIVEKYIKKGSQLYIEGKIRTRSYNDKEGNTKYMTEIIADSLQMLGRKGDSDNQSSYTPKQSPTPQSQKSTLNEVSSNNDEDEDDLPF
jgi:single-strand DNA-binding protein